MAPKDITPSSHHSWSSSEESPRSVIHESVEGIPLKNEKVDRSQDALEFNDEFSVLVRKGSTGWALYSVLVISVLISCISFVLMYEYVPPLQQVDATSIQLWSDVCTRPLQRNTVWADLLSEQIEILQNLIHASLLGGAALVAAYRGDVVWLFFVRNCLFYFVLAASSFLVIDTLSGDATSWRWSFALLFCFFGAIGFIKLESTCQSLRKLQLRFFAMSMTSPSSLKEGMDRDNLELPEYQAQTGFQQSRANVIFKSAVFVQIVSVAYVACTTVFAILPSACDDEDDTTNPHHRHVEGIVPDHQDMPSSTSLSPFQMGYSLGAHEAFLLALFMLASTFPRSPTSVGGALLTSAWRLIIACCSLFSLFSMNVNSTTRTYMSFAFTLLEAASMLPILVASFQLTMEAGTFQTVLGKIRRQRASNGTSTAAYAPVAGSEFDDKNSLGSEIENGCYTANEECTIHRMTVPTLRLIAKSSRFSTRQRLGAAIMWTSSTCLLIGMTLENMALLVTTPVGSHSTHEIYKWGMHLCAMYAFCVVMNVPSPSVYAQTRRLLCFACPAGSLIGIWQLRTLVTSTPDLTEDPMALFVACLFAWRALCGVGQCLGLFALDTIEPERTSLERMKVATNDSALEEDAMLRQAIWKGRFALFRLFLPSFVVYTATSALFSNCSEPMISPTIPFSCDGAVKMLMVVPNWPGLGLFFHFGGLLAIFASDGLTTSIPSYPPSVMIGALFALHSSILIATHLTMELALHPNVIDYVEAFGWEEWTRRIALIGWMLSSFYLYVCLNRVWKLRQPVDF